MELMDMNKEDEFLLNIEEGILGDC